MMKRFVGAVVVAAMCVAVSPASAQQKPVPAAEVAKIKADVIKAANDYLATFSKEDWKGVAENVYSHPAIQNGPTGVSNIDPAKQIEGYTSNVKNMKAAGWVKSAFYNPTVCVINPNTALMSSRFRRYDKDNKVIAENAETGLFAKVGDNWKLVGLFGHVVDKVITCND